MGCSEGHFSSGRSCIECSGEGLPCLAWRCYSGSCHPTLSYTPSLAKQLVRSWLIKTGLALLLFFLFLIATFIIAHTVYSWHPGQHAQEICWAMVMALSK